MSSKDDNDNENDNIIIKQLNDSLDEIIDKSKSFDNKKKIDQKSRKSK